MNSHVKAAEKVSNGSARASATAAAVLAAVRISDVYRELSGTAPNRTFAVRQI